MSDVIASTSNNFNIITTTLRGIDGGLHGHGGCFMSRPPTDVLYSGGSSTMGRARGGKEIDVGLIDIFVGVVMTTPFDV